MSKEFKIGLITIIAGSLLYYGFNFLRGTDIFSKTNRYYVIYPNVSGLNISNPVLFNGLKVGRVSDLKLDQRLNRIIVAIDIDAKFLIRKLDTASLANNDFFGTKAIVLHAGKDPNPCNVGDTLLANIDEDILSQLEPVANNITTTLQKVDVVLDHLIATDLPGLVDTMKYSVGTVTAKINSLEIQSVIQNLDEVVISFKDRSTQLDTLLGESNILMGSLNSIEYARIVNNLNETLKEAKALLRAIQSEQGTIGKLMKEDSLYNNLNAVLVDLDRLIIHFNNHPKDFMKPLGRKRKNLRGLSEPTAADK